MPLRTNGCRARIEEAAHHSVVLTQRAVEGATAECLGMRVRTEAGLAVAKRHFEATVRENRFDAGELAMVTYLQAKRVGVRTYAQTTALWVRGILRHEYGVDLDKVTWCTGGEGYLAEYADVRTPGACPGVRTSAR